MLKYSIFNCWKKRIWRKEISVSIKVLGLGSSADFRVRSKIVRIKHPQILQYLPWNDQIFTLYAYFIIKNHAYVMRELCLTEKSTMHVCKQMHGFLTGDWIHHAYSWGHPKSLWLEMRRFDGVSMVIRIVQKRARDAMLIITLFQSVVKVLSPHTQFICQIFPLSEI